MKDRLLRQPDLAPYFPEGQVPHTSTLNRWERAGQFPAARRISKRYKAWRKSEIEAWCYKAWRKSEIEAWFERGEVAV